MKKLTVGLGERSYPILIGPDLLNQPDRLTPHISGKRVLIVTNETVAPLYLDSVQQALAGFQIDTLVLPDGEQYKTLDSLERIFSCLLENHHGRDTTLLALGGGVVGDMAGFAAACYQRGVDFIQLPTTLLAQVDSSVGGKTAVNHPLGKNMIGAFWQPRLVLIDIDTLSSLPRRELSAGMAEVIKYGILGDAEFFDWLETNIDRLMALHPDVLVEAIERCCQLKADIVAADETERGQRALLNLGHTFGHAIEAEQGYGNWLHGEGVAAGMVLAARLAVQLGSLDAASLARIEALIRRAELPTAPPADMGLEAFVRHMRRDKKVQDGTMRFILPEAIGHSVIRSDISEHQLAELFANAPS